MRVVLAAVIVLLGCSERPASTVTSTSSSPSLSPTPSPLVATASDLARRTAKMPPPIRMPDGGVRIDMRGTIRHVHTLDRQPDGKYRRGCVDPPGAPSSQGTK